MKNIKLNQRLKSCRIEKVILFRRIINSLCNVIVFAVHSRYNKP